MVRIFFYSYYLEREKIDRLISGGGGCWWWWGFGVVFNYWSIILHTDSLSLSISFIYVKWKNATTISLLFFYFTYVFNFTYHLLILPLAITKNHFNFHYVVGRGGFGKVWKVEKKKTKKLYAMKEMSKARIMLKRSVNSVMNERKLLANLKHPFLVNMSYAFQD